MINLIKKVEQKAKEVSDGHYTILKFTSGYKGFFGTPNLDFGEERKRVSKLKAFSELNDLLKHMLKE